MSGGAHAPNIDRRTDMHGLKDADATVHAYMLNANVPLTEKIIWAQSAAENIRKNHKLSGGFNKVRERWGSHTETRLAQKLGHIGDGGKHEDISHEHYETKAHEHTQKIQEIVYDLIGDVLAAHGFSKEEWDQAKGTDGAFEMAINRLKGYAPGDEGKNAIERLKIAVTSPGEELEMGEVYKIIKNASDSIISPGDDWLSRKVSLLDSVHSHLSDRKKDENKAAYEQFLSPRYKKLHDVGLSNASNSDLALAAINSYQGRPLDGGTQKALGLKAITKMDESPAYRGDDHHEHQRAA